MRILGILINLIVIVCAVIIGFDGIEEFDKADTGVEIFRGLFYLLVGAIAFSLSLRDLAEEFKKR